MSDVKSYTEDELATVRRDVDGRPSRLLMWRDDEVQRFLATLDAERSARVRAEAELHRALTERDTAHADLSAAGADLDAARGLLRECRPHVERSPFRGTRDVILARIDAIAPAAEGHKTSESGNDSATPAPGQGTAPSRPADAPLEPGTTTATAPADGERWGVFIGDHRCQFGTGTEVDMRAHAAGFNAGRKPSQEQYEARPLSPIPRTGGDGGK